jgi:ketosteroid isomerase-like protein
MSEYQNKQIIRQAYDYFKQGDAESLLGLMAEDVEWEVPKIKNVPFAVGKIQGKNEVGKFFATIAEHEELLEFDAREFIAEGNKVTTLVKYVSKIRSNGRKFETMLCHLFTIRDGKIAGFYEMFDTLVVSDAFQKAQAV